VITISRSHPVELDTRDLGRFARKLRKEDFQKGKNLKEKEI
jgi:hypothetical protein